VGEVSTTLVGMATSELVDANVANARQVCDVGYLAYAVP
jgi:hypothetical protein